MMKIALCGKLRSGKDTVAEMLTKSHDVLPYAFSEGIWETIELLFPYAYANRHNEKPRRLLQEVGQKMRMVEPNVWVNRTMNRILVDGYPNVVITDLRQPNEYEELRKKGYFIVRVSSDVDTRIERAEASGDSFNRQDLLHETERHVGGFVVDYELSNDGTLDELEEMVEEMVRFLKEKEFEAEMKRISEMDYSANGGETT